MVAARCGGHLGGGLPPELPGHRWHARPGGGVPLRVPKAGTLDDLLRKHADFLGRLSKRGFAPVPPLSCFDVLRLLFADGVWPVPDPVPPTRGLRDSPDDRGPRERREDAGKSKFRPFHHVRRPAPPSPARCAHPPQPSPAESRLVRTRDPYATIEGHDDVPAVLRPLNDRLRFLPLPSITLGRGQRHPPSSGRRPARMSTSPV